MTARRKLHSRGPMCGPEVADMSEGDVVSLPAKVQCFEALEAK